MVSDGRYDLSHNFETNNTLRHETGTGTGRYFSYHFNGELSQNFHPQDTYAKEYGKQLFGIGEVIAVSIGVNTGLGKRLSLLNGAQKNSVEKVRAFRYHV